MTTWNANIYQFVDGVDTLSAADVNPVITTLANRDQFLFEQLNSYSDKTILLSYNQPIIETTAPGQPVYFDTTSGQPILRPAQGGFLSTSTPAHLEPAPSAYVFGIVRQIYSGTSSDPVMYGDVYVRGLVNGNDDDYPITFLNILDTESGNEVGGTLPPGPLYLSSTEPGKLTIFPSGAAIFVGYYLGNNQLVLAPNIDSLNQLYFNYRMYLLAATAGTPNAIDDTHWNISHSISPASDMANKVGWVNATDATIVLGITPPTNALFYYNLPTNEVILETTEDNTQLYYLTAEQKNDAMLLKQALPAYPGAYTMLFANGVLQTMNDVDHNEGAYIIDENGIWWCLNTTGYVPWATDSAPLITQLLITKLNPNYEDSVVTSLTSGNEAISITNQDGGPATTGDLTIKLLLPITNVAGSGSGQAIQSISFDQTGGNTTTVTTPVINQIQQGPGISVTQNQPGVSVISLVNYSLSGEVEDIEPQEADFVYKGLHSYLRLKQPATNQQIGFIGKLRIPDQIPANTNLSLKLVAFADSPTASTNTSVTFEFDFATSNEQGTISSAIYPNTVTVPGSAFNALQQATVYLNGSNPPTGYFVIPFTYFSAGSYVNFRISRTSAGNYPNPIGILGVLWAIS